MKNKTKFQEKLLIGSVPCGLVTRKVYLSAPSWDCDWYWGFGYLGNKTMHFHVNGLKTIDRYNVEKNVREYEFVNLFDGFKKKFGDSLVVTDDKDLWKLCDLFQSFYTLKEVAALYRGGCSHYTDVNNIGLNLTNLAQYKEINYELIPKIFDAIYDILIKYQK
jgi:hypothetical protein